MKVKRKKLARLLGAVIDAITYSNVAPGGHWIPDTEYQRLVIMYQSFTTDKCGCGAEKE